MSKQSSETGLAVAIDIGGTFTDIALADSHSGRIWRAKTPSTPDDPSVSFMEGIRLAMKAAALDASDIGQVLHGTTVATNMILEGTGARAALVTTRDFRHVLTIGRQDIPRKANLYTWVKPARPVPPEHVFEVTERVGPGGEVLVSLNEKDVTRVAEKLRQLQIEAVAVCLLHSFANPAHEVRVAELLRDALPGVAVTASHDVLPVVREFERSMATVMNAVVMPGIAKYVTRLEERLLEAGIEAPLMLMQSNGGTTGVASIRQAPVLTALSGPAAGVVGARAVAALSAHDNIITVDIGGTSADICLVRNGEIGLTQKGYVGDWPLPFPMVDMLTIGAGGGSIARVTDGTLSVGPESAGAAPGPACYGQGGALPTITDAHVVLGNLPSRLLDGRMLLNRDAAAAAINAHVAEPLEISLTAAAQGILDIANNQMIGAIRVVSVERGHDPRDFTLVPFGGAGPLHGVALAELLSIGRVLIPPAPGVLCADGLLAADLRSEFIRTLPLPGPIDEVDCAGLLEQLRGEAETWFDAEKVSAGKRDIRQVASMRFVGQGGELDVTWAPDAGELAETFAAAHEAQYGFRLPAPVEIVALRTEARARTERAASAALPAAGSADPVDHQTVSFAGGSTEAPVYNRRTLTANAELIGPAIVTQLDCTTLIPPGWRADVLETGALLLNRQDVQS